MTVVELIKELEKMPQDRTVGTISESAYFPISSVYISEHHLIKGIVIID